MTQKDVLALVEEGGIGQDRQSAEPDQSGGVTDEIKIALIEVGRPAACQFQGSHRVLSFGPSPIRLHVVVFKQLQSEPERMDWLDPFDDQQLSQTSLLTTAAPSGITSNVGILGAVRSRALCRATVRGAGKVNEVVTLPLIRSPSFRAIRAGCAK